MAMVMAIRVKNNLFWIYFTLETLTTYYSRSISRIKANSCWYAIYTRPHYEIDVYRWLQEMTIPCYLRLLTTLRQWDERKKKVSIPLFSCYVFVKISAKDYYRVLNVPSVRCHVSFEGKAIAISEKQIQMVRNILEQDILVEEIQDILHKGIKVEIIADPLNGFVGELIDFAGKKRVIIRLNAIRKSMVISAPCGCLN
jgi:transcription antitermination factor NusG